MCGLYVIDCVFKMMTGLKYVMALNSIIFFYTSNKHYADAVHEPQHNNELFHWKSSRALRGEAVSGGRGDVLE